MIELITAALGIAGTLIAWFLNPKRAMYAELDSIQRQLEELYVKRDDALSKNNSDVVTVVTADIIRLLNRKTQILQRK